MLTYFLDDSIYIDTVPFYCMHFNCNYYMAIFGKRKRFPYLVIFAVFVYVSLFLHCLQVLQTNQERDIRSDSISQELLANSFSKNTSV